MTPDINIKFDGGYLRPLAVSDIHERYFKGLNDPEINKYLFAVKSSVQTRDSVATYVEHNIKSTNAVLFGIFVNDQDVFSGTLRIHEIDNYFGLAHLGICIFDKNIWGRGIGAKAVNAACTWCFNDLSLRWIEAGLFSENTASKKTFINSGFELICVYPDKYLLEGKPSPVMIYAKKRNG